MVLRFQRAGLGPALKKMGAMHPGWVETNQKYKKEKDFVEVFMVCVPLEHQGKGYLRKLLEEPFALARSMDCPCIIDTYTELRAAKYQHVGMKVTDHKSYPQNVEMYSLEYRG